MIFNGLRSFLVRFFQKPIEGSFINMISMQYSEDPKIISIDDQPLAHL